MINETYKGRKRTYAQILAQESVDVVFSPTAKTASFDVVKRIVTLPIMEDDRLSDDNYNGFSIHEIGHALFTDERIMDTVPTYGHSFVNVIEDLKINNCLKDKFAGVTAIFKEHYQSLWNNGFYGADIADRVHGMHILDKINLRHKVDNDIIASAFDEKEEELFQSIKNILTYDDFIRACEEVKKFITDNQQEQNQDDATNQHPEQGEQMEQDDQDDQEQSSPNQEQDDSENDQEQSGDSGESGDESEDDQENDSHESGDEDGDESEDGESGDGESEDGEDGESDSDTESEDEGETDSSTGGNDQSGEFDPDEFESETENELEKNLENALGDEAKASHSDYHKTYFFGKDSTFGDSDTVDVATVTKGIYKRKRTYKSRELQEHASFVKKSKAIVRTMSSIFQKKKAASEFRRTRTEKSGRLDMKKIHNYKFSEDIFQNFEIMPDGKNHGVVFFIDMSSSMEGYRIQKVVKQMLIMTDFCRSINIPFRVYGFITCNDYNFTHGMGEDYRLTSNGGYKLIEFMSSKMSANVYRNAHKYMYIKVGGWNWRQKIDGINFDFGATPFQKCIVGSSRIIGEFKKENNVEICNAIYLADGDDNCGISVQNEGNPTLDLCPITIVDEVTKNKYQFFGSNGNLASIKLMRMVKERHNCNTIFLRFERMVHNYYALNREMPDNVNEVILDDFEIDGVEVHLVNDDIAGNMNDDTGVANLAYRAELGRNIDADLVQKAIKDDSKRAKEERMLASKVAESVSVGI